MASESFDEGIEEDMGESLADLDASREYGGAKSLHEGDSRGM
jgi:hypothetical protein